MELAKLRLSYLHYGKSGESNLCSGKSLQLVENKAHGAIRTAKGIQYFSIESHSATFFGDVALREGLDVILRYRGRSG